MVASKLPALEELIKELLTELTDELLIDELLLIELLLIELLIELIDELIDELELDEITLEFMDDGDGFDGELDPPPPPHPTMLPPEMAKHKYKLIFDRIIKHL